MKNITISKTEFEACKAVAEDLFIKEVSKNDN